MTSEKRQNSLRDVFRIKPIFGLIFATVLITTYELKTKWIYFWDSADYWDTASRINLLFRTSINGFLSTLWNSGTTHYPSYWAIPFIIVPHRFIVHRIGFTLPLVLISITALRVALSKSRQIVDFTSGQMDVLWIILIISPPFWYVATVGDPAIISFALIIFVIFQSMRNTISRQELIKCYFLLTIALAIRETAIFMIVNLSIWLILNQIRTMNLTHLIARPTKGEMFSVLGIFSVIFLNRGEFLQILNPRSVTYYSSFSLPLRQYLNLILKVNGVLGIFLLVVLSFSGTIALAKKRNIQQGMYLLPLVFLMELVTLRTATAYQQVAQIDFWTLFFLGVLFLRNRVHKMVTMALVAALSLATTWAFTSFYPISAINLNELNSIFPITQRPPVRYDFGAIQSLRTFAKEDQSNKGKPSVFFPASASYGLNLDLLSRVIAPFGVVPMTGDVDGRDAIFWTNIQSSDYVLLTTDFQWHLNPQAHQIMRAPYDMYMDLKREGQLRLVSEYNLQGVGRVGLYKVQSKPNLMQIFSGQKELARLSSKYNIPTVLGASKWYLQSNPSSAPILKIFLYQPNDFADIFLPANVTLTIVKNQACVVHTSVLNFSPVSNSWSSISILPEKGFRMATESLLRVQNFDNSNCTYEIHWS